MVTMSKRNRYKNDMLNYVAIVAIVILINYILSFAFGRFDMTADKRYSLSNSTLELLKDSERLNERVFFRIYLDGDLPADFVRIKNAIKEKLDEFIVYAGDNIQYEFIDPNADENEEYNFEVQRGLYDDGLRPTVIKIQKNSEINEKIIWPGALVEYKGSTVDHIQFFSQSKVDVNTDMRVIADGVINSLEYKLVETIRRVTNDDKKSIGFLQGHGELDQFQTFDAREGLKVHYSVEDVAIEGKIDALNDYDALVIAKPTQRFSEKDKFVIDQFIMNGGRVMWFVDPMNPNLDSLYSTGITYSLPYDLNIEKDMLYKYGVRLNSNILLDENCAPLYIPPLNGTFPWYLSPKLLPQDHVITANLDPVRGNYTSSADPVNESDTAVTKTVLLRTSPNSIFYKSPARMSFELVVEGFKPNFNNPKLGDFPVAVLLEGTFKSAFENRINDAFLNSPDFETKFTSQYNRMLVVSDGDVIQNMVDVQGAGEEMKPYPLKLDYEYFVPDPSRDRPMKLYSNLDFILNTMDYMLEDNSLLDLRSKSISFRMLDRDKIAENRSFWTFINIFFPILLIGLLALIQLIRRRQKFAR